jgi:hypothetical protein
MTRLYGAVADAGVEHPDRRRSRMDVSELFRDAVRHFPFFAARVDEQQVFLPVVEEAEIALRVAGLACLRRRRGRAGAALARALDDCRPAGLRGMRRHETVNTVERVGGDAAAVAQPRRQFAVIDGTPAKRRFRKSSAPAVIRNFLEQLLCVHCPSPAANAGPRKLPQPRLVVGIVGAATL